jgi:plastocyanin
MLVQLPKTKTLVGLAATLMLVGAACSKSSNPAPAGSGSSGAAGVTVQQGAGGLVFAPATFSVKKGETINVTNVGTASHTFTITGKGIDVLNNPGQSQTVTINLAPGTYDFICRFHVSSGMKGTLTVTS